MDSDTPILDQLATESDEYAQLAASLDRSDWFADTTTPPQDGQGNGD
jgi:hypothetical protein